MKINDRPINQDHSPYIIAELGINHNGDVAIARKLLEAAAQSGADAAKLQTFKTENFISRSSDFFDLLKDTELSAEDNASLIDQAKALGITLFSAVFDEQSADLWAGMDATAYKMASGELTHLPLLRHVAAKGRPMIISTGGGTVEEIDAATTAIKNAGPNTQYAILHCISNYPTQPKDANLACMAGLRDRFGVPVGFSDHTEGIGTAIAAAALGAEIIEKHFTLDRSMPGPDQALSTAPDEFKVMVDCIRDSHAAIGSSDKVPVEPADFIPQIRRSLTMSKDIAAGATITADMIAFKRPGTGIAPDDVDKVVGQKAAQDIIADETLTWDMVQNPND